MSLVGIKSIGYHFLARFRLAESLAWQRMTVLTAHFDGKAIIPDEPVELPVNCALKVQVEPLRETVPTATHLHRLVQIAKKYPVTGGPADGAAQHDHYLYGLPKKP